MTGEGMRHAGTGSAAEWDELHAQLHELEVLMEETEVPPPLLSAYWELSADLIATIEEMATIVAALRTGVLDQRERITRYRAMRQRVLGLQARTQEISLDAEGDGAEAW